MKRRIKINGIFLFIFIVIFLSFHKFFSGHWKYEFLDEILDIIGLSLLCLGFLLRISSRGHKSEKSEGGRRLVLDGPYSFVRNPMYLGIVMIGTGIILFLSKWWLVFIFILLFFIRFLPQIKKEEYMLNKHFGSMYQQYCKRTPRLFPNIAVFFRKDISEILLLRYHWIKKEIVTIVAILGAIFLIELHEDVSHYGKIEYIKETFLLLNVLTCFILLFLFLLKRKECL